MAKENKRVVVMADVFGDHEILALSKACPEGVKEKAREKLKTGVYRVDVVVRLIGDIEVGVAERVPDKFESAKYLVAALAQLTPRQRKSVLSRPAVKKDVRAVIEAELKAVKAKLPKHVGPAKLTPHLRVLRVGGLAEHPPVEVGAG